MDAGWPYLATNKQCGCLNTSNLGPQVFALRHVDREACLPLLWVDAIAELAIGLFDHGVRESLTNLLKRALRVSGMHKLGCFIKRIGLQANELDEGERWLPQR